MDINKVQDELENYVEENELKFKSGIMTNLIKNEPVEDFPVNVFPEPLARFVKEGAEALYCPSDFIAVPLLGFLGVAIGMTKRAEVKPGWTESSNLYLSIVGRPGSKKSPALELAQTPINKINKYLKNDFENKKEEYEKEYDEYEKKYEIYKELQKKDKDPGQKPEKPQEPEIKRIFTADATVEALCDLLEKNPRGLAIIRDELSGWVRSLNQYKGKGADRQFFLTTWSNKPFPVDRKSKAPINLEKPFLSVIGGIQSDMLDELVDEKNREDGFVNRILFTYPNEIQQAWSDAVISDSAIEEVNKIFLKLYELEPSFSGKSEINPKLIPFSEKALNEFKNWFNENSRQIQDFNLSYSLVGAWGKMPSQLVRIALILQLTWWAAGEVEDDYIDKCSVIGAVGLIEYFKSNARKVYKRLYEDAKDKKLEKVVDWILKNGQEGITPRDLQRYKVCNIKKSSEAKKIINELIDRELGDYFDAPQTGKGKRVKKFFLY